MSASQMRDQNIWYTGSDSYLGLGLPLVVHVPRFGPIFAFVFLAYECMMPEECTARPAPSTTAPQVAFPTRGLVF